MSRSGQSGKRIVPVGVPPGAAGEPRLRPVRPRRIKEYAWLPAAYLEVAQNYASPLLFGPPICDELVAIVEHLFTEEEASLVRHLRTPLGRTAQAVANAEQQPVEDVRSILDNLALEKFVLFAYGDGERRRYGLMPLLPGVFEMVLVRTSLDSLTDWHRRFAALFEDLYETGYFVGYVERPIPGVRYIPVGEAIEGHPQVLPSDRLEEVLDGYEVFAVGLCQCRMSARLLGRGCDRPLEACFGFGSAAEYLIRHGKMRRVDRQEVLDLKAQATAAGLVSFVTETGMGKNRLGASCSCCGCCCGGLRLIREFNAPGLIAPPHFMPLVDPTLCTYCARCAEACPTGAMVVDAAGKLHRHLPERCIGCGLCVVACDRQGAIRMEPLPDYRRPPRNILATLLQVGPNYLRNAWSARRQYR